MILKVFFLGGGILRRPAAASVNRTTGATLRVEGVFCRPVALCSRHQCLYPELIPFFFVFFLYLTSTLINSAPEACMMH